MFVCTARAIQYGTRMSTVISLRKSDGSADKPLLLKSGVETPRAAYECGDDGSDVLCA